MERRPRELQSESQRRRPGLDALLEDFALRLEADGLSVERSVPWGASTGDDAVVPPIDIAVRDDLTGRRLAVESDGTAYAALASVRERDRMRAERLSRLGWDHLRVWSTDIFRDPAREVARVRRALQPPGQRADDLDVPTPEPEPEPESAPTPAQQPDASEQPVGSEPSPAGEPEPEEVSAEQAAQTRRALRDLEATPEEAEQTKDDTDVGWGEVPTGDDPRDEWLRDQRPPHWD